MEKDKVLGLLDKATAHRSETTQLPQINLVWRSAWLSVRGDKQFAQAVVGRSQEGYHPGLYNSHPERSLKAHWGQPLPTEKEAKTCAQGAAATWLQMREEALAKTPEKARRGPAMSR